MRFKRRVCSAFQLLLIKHIMDSIPSKRKRLIKSDSDTEQEDEGQEFSSQLSASDRKVSFASPSQEPTPVKEMTPPTIDSMSPTAEPNADNADNTVAKKKQPRLVMKKMVLNNFKSYAGRQVIGPFHKVGTVECNRDQVY
ncbi:hypothetical protein BD408DRAFT_105 [Parasitella parasitica]|nr:hypothetical protein BD408DRAFT_105 [Parasitella parasitica]